MVSHCYLLPFYLFNKVVSLVGKLSYRNGLQCGSISLSWLPMYPLQCGNINEKFHHVLSAFFILVWNLYQMDDFVVSIGINLGASSKSFGIGKLSIGQ